MDPWDDVPSPVLTEEGAIDVLAARSRLATPRPLYVNPYVALLEEVTRTHLRVTLLESEVERYDAADGAHHSRAGQRTLARWERERDRLIKICDRAISLGIAERHVRVAELEGATLGRMMIAVARDLGLTDEQRRRLPELLRTRMAEVIELNSMNDEGSKDAE